VTFVSALRSFLRQDPDIIMVGEIRDAETADIATKAALTGHLVLSTLHTNDAPSAVMRLKNMGLEPFLIAAALRLVVAQRLIRLLCPDCRRPATEASPALATWKRLAPVDGSPAAALPARPALHDAVGCPRCGGSGYRGRSGLFEVMNMSDSLADLIVGGAPTGEVKRRAVAEGMLTLRQSGLRLAAEGKTTLEEVIRVTGES
jgi:type II secretory ATPase GspE/PulE/Tfp pilus assembly ATPase PilB-like protein